MIRSTDTKRPEGMTPEQTAYVDALHKALEQRQKPSFIGWPIERWLAIIAVVSTIVGGIVITGIRWHDIDVIAADQKRLEARMDALPTTNDLLYARRDVYDERMKNIVEKLDALIIDVKSVRMSVAK